MTQTTSTWLVRCTNPQCGYSYENFGQLDVICPRCGGFTAVTERIDILYPNQDNTSSVYNQQ